MISRRSSSGPPAAGKQTPARSILPTSVAGHRHSTPTCASCLVQHSCRGRFISPVSQHNAVAAHAQLPNLQCEGRLTNCRCQTLL